jgi:hypothetical protein
LNPEDLIVAPQYLTPAVPPYSISGAGQFNFRAQGARLAIP